MTFLAPWAFAIGAVAAAGAVVLHLVARQRPAAYMLPTTRFIPDQRTLVSRVATKPRDLSLLALRVLLLLAVAAAFARPVLTPARGTVAHVILLDRSSAVASAGDAVARARALVPPGDAVTIVAFDSVPSTLSGAPWDSLARSATVGGRGSLSAALIAARRAGVGLAERADSVRLHVVSPLAEGEFDSATKSVRAEWPGALHVERVTLRGDSVAGWRLEQPLSNADPLGPSMSEHRVTGTAAALVSRLVRTAPSAADSAFARSGGTVVRWDTVAAPRVATEGLAAGDDVIVATLGRRALPRAARVIARWADGSAAAVEERAGAGCMRAVGVVLPAAGDIALHAPFQRIARGLLAPCGTKRIETLADSAAVERLVGPARVAATSGALRGETERPSPLAPWLLAFALLLAVAELFVRALPAPEVA